MREIHHKSFTEWAASQSDQDFKNIEHRGQLKREDIKNQCGFGRSILGSNPDIKRDLAKLEKDLRARGVLPKKVKDNVNTNKKASSNPNSEEYDQSASNTKALIRRNQQLEAENLQLKADNARLKRALEPYREVAEVLAETGINLR
ncbi:hypothetical protein BIT28_07560 [Photobacterium proteolyticum]|uniref:Uncharacterized protein n=2 Tax=Photobacterium proteolyticum TaxID=1903952 RepID=A0A1Q9G6K1_9GAMM|nr:hypothetical protein BIT28_07560 [Photobacterium proteolyticum]